MSLARSIAAAPLVLALCSLSAAASAQARAPSAIAAVRPVPAGPASAASSLDPATVLAYTQQQLAKRDRELQQTKQQQPLAKTAVGQQFGKDTEMNMLGLQSNVSKRSNQVQLTNDLIRSQAAAASAARNVGR